MKAKQEQNYKSFFSGCSLSKCQEPWKLVDATCSLKNTEEKFIKRGLTAHIQGLM